jgi:hypothetical protein
MELEPATQVIHMLARAAHAAPSADNLQPLRFVHHERTLTFLPRYTSGPTFPRDHPATYLAAGAALENAVQAAEAMEVGVSAVIPSSTADHYVAMTVDPGERDVASRVESHGLFARHTNRHPFRPTPVDDDVLTTIAEMREADARVVLMRRRDQIDELADVTRLASEVRFRTPEIHRWFAASLRFTPTAAACGDGLDVRTFDLPPGGYQFMRYIAEWRRLENLNRIGVYRLLASIEAKYVRTSPLAVGIIGQPNANAGRLMERVWIELNAHGVAVQPFYVIPDQIQRLAAQTVPSPMQESVRSLERRTRALLDIAAGESLQMVLRAGLPSRPAVRSLRLPLQDVLSPL